MNTGGPPPELFERARLMRDGLITAVGTRDAATVALAQCVFSTCRQRTKGARVLNVVVVTDTGRDAGLCRWDDSGVLVVKRIVCADGFKCHRVLTSQIDRTPWATQTNEC